MKKIKWVFFDIGSTLVDETRCYEHRLKDAIRGTGISYPAAYAEVLRFATHTAEPIKAFAAAHTLALTPWHSEDEFVYPEAKAVLSALHKQYKIGIIANQPPGTAERLRAYGLFEDIDLIIASAEEKLSKPDPKIFSTALKRAGCAAENAVMVGDRLDNDIAPAKALGMQTLWVKQGFGGMGTVQSDAQKPDYRAKDLNEVLKILEGTV